MSGREARSSAGRAAAARALALILIGTLLGTLLVALPGALPGALHAQALEVLMSQSGFAFWLQQRFSPLDARLAAAEARASALEGRLEDWQRGYLRRMILRPGDARVELFHPGGESAGLVQLDVAPALIGGRTMAPLRFVGESLGAEVIWIAETRQAAYIAGERQILLTEGLTTVLVNGREETIDTPPTVVDGRTLVPLRFVSQWLGAVVRWDESLRQVEIRYR